MSAPDLMAALKTSLENPRPWGSDRVCQRCGGKATHVTIRLWGRSSWLTWWFCDEHRTKRSEPIATARPR